MESASYSWTGGCTHVILRQIFFLSQTYDNPSMFQCYNMLFLRMRRDSRSLLHPVNILSYSQYLCYLKSPNTTNLEPTIIKTYGRSWH